VTGVLATWTVRRLAEQTIVVPVQENAVASVTPQVAAGAGGLVLFGSSAPTNLGESLQRLVQAAPDGVRPFVMTDEEGGPVQRMANLVGLIPSARQMGARMTPAQITSMAAALGRRMRASGVSMDLAPVLDVDGRPGPSDIDPIGARSFSADPAVASRDALAFAAGLASSGVVPVVKHFPGLGAASGNSDLGPAATQPWRSLKSGGLAPFEAAFDAHVPAVMVANATVPGLTDLPASISASVITGVLRVDLAYRGLVLTDSLSAVALASIGYSVPRAATAALEAGADMVIFNATPGTVARLTDQTVLAVMSAVDQGTLERARLVDAVTHILSAKQLDLCATH
jgi:beta-N-acetylhexosaminidase